jgi:hypothetical protein
MTTGAPSPPPVASLLSDQTAPAMPKSMDKEEKKEARNFGYFVAIGLGLAIAAIAIAALVISLKDQSPFQVSGQLLTQNGPYNDTLLTTAGYTKAAGFDTAQYLANMATTGTNRLIYTGGSDALLQISLTVNFNAQPGSSVYFAVGINGVVDLDTTPGIGVSASNAGYGYALSITPFLYWASPGDYFEVWVQAQVTNTTLFIYNQLNVLSIVN